MVLTFTSGVVVVSPVGVSVVFLSPLLQEASKKVIAVNNIRALKGWNLFILFYFLMMNEQGGKTGSEG